MRLLLALPLAAAGLVAAQSFPGVPACAIPCLTEAIPKVGCALTDEACLCSPDKQQALVPIVAPCLLSNCSSADVTQAQSAAAADCAAFLSSKPSATPGPAMSSAPAPAMSSAMSMPMPMSSAPAPAMSSAMSMSMPMSPSVTPSASMSTGPTPSSNGTAPATRTATAGAPHGTAAVGGLLIAALAGLAAAL